MMWEVRRITDCGWNYTVLGSRFSRCRDHVTLAVILKFPNGGERFARRGLALT